MHRIGVILLVAVAASLTACSTAERPPAAAVWNLIETPSPESTQVTIWVTRLSCANGVTGEVYPPELTYSSTQVVIEASVALLPAGDGVYTCPGNDAVAVPVALTEPLGDRQLVDGACLEGEAVTTTLCDDDGVRWSPGM